MNLLVHKFKEVTFSVLPITLLVLLLHFTLVPIETNALLRFLLGAIFIIFGLGIFLFGAQIGIEEIGRLMGETLAKANHSATVGLLGFLLGFLITIAEPDLQILAKEANTASGGTISGTLILIVVSIGVGVMVALGLLRIVYSKKLNRFLLVIYSLIFILGLFVIDEFLAISVDASGATTGAMTTPFILALGLGVSQFKGGNTSEEDSFGLVGLASTGPILAIMLMSLLKGITHVEGSANHFQVSSGILQPYFSILPATLKESIFTFLPLLILFLVFNQWKFKLSQRNRNLMLKGLLYTYLGLSLFLVGVNAGFMEIGRMMGEGLATNYFSLLPWVGLALGMVVVLAEPAVYILTQQIEEVTSGHLKKNVILLTLSIGIAIAVALSMIRIMTPSLRLWHLLLPGFALGTLLSFKVPPIFVGIAYDSGGVASGPMTATFILAFTQGAAHAIPTANVLVDGFGVIATVAMTPIVALQILGLIFKIRERRQLEYED